MRMNGKARFMAVTVCTAFLMAGTGACGTSISVVTEGSAQGPTIAIGVAADQPGLGYLHGGEYSGFDIDVAKYVAKTLGYAEKQIVFKQMTPSDRISSLDSGIVDMVVDSVAMGGSHDDEAIIAGPYLTVNEALLVRSDNVGKISGLDDMSGKTACVVKGSVFDDSIRDDSRHMTVSERGTYPQCMTALMIGEADAVIADDAIAAGLASKGRKGYLTSVTIPNSRMSYGIAVKAGQNELGRQIDSALRAMVKDGSWQRAADTLDQAVGYVVDAKLNPPSIPSKQ